eukprot:COSAG02_NODE_5110_length_4620_cov_1.897810_1_plen_530_part_00
METKLLRKPWLSHALCSLLSVHRQPNVAVPLVQLIQVDKKKSVEDRQEAIVSDRYHYIRAVFTDARIESFFSRRVYLGTITTQPCARKLAAVNGGFLKLRRFHFKFTPDGQRVTLLVQAFDFIGGEETYTVGDPTDVHDAALVQRFKDVLPKGWSYQMDRARGFTMCEYDECEIPQDQQELLDQTGWAFPTAAGANARPAGRAVLATPVHGEAAGSDKTDAHSQLDCAAKAAGAAIDAVTSAPDDDTDRLVVSPRPERWRHDDREGDVEQEQPFVLVYSDGESSYSEDEEPADTPSGANLDVVAAASTDSSKETAVATGSGNAAAAAATATAAAAIDSDDYDATQPVENDEEPEANEEHAERSEQDRHARKRPRICRFEQQPAPEHSGRSNQRPRLAARATAGSDTEVQPGASVTRKLQSVSVTASAAATVASLSGSGCAAATATASTAASNNSLRGGVNRVNKVQKCADTGAEAGGGAKAAAKLVTERYYQSLLAGGQKKKRRLLAKQGQRKQQAPTSKQQAAAGWRC